MKVTTLCIKLVKKKKTIIIEGNIFATFLNFKNLQFSQPSLLSRSLCFSQKTVVFLILR